MSSMYKRAGTIMVDGKKRKVYIGDRGGKFYVKNRQKIYIYKTSTYHSAGD